LIEVDNSIGGDRTCFGPIQKSLRLVSLQLRHKLRFSPVAISYSNNSCFLTVLVCFGALTCAADFRIYRDDGDGKRGHPRMT
jgi:hypothetical protein